MSKEITIESIKELRDITGISVIQCKNALEEAEGDNKKALAILKKTSSDIAFGKANRKTKDGRVSIKTGDLSTGQVGKKSILIALRCETDFVSKNENFVNLLSNLENIAFKEGIDKMKASAKDMIDPVIQKTGEKIELGDVYEVKGNILGNYIHNNKIAVIVSLEGGNEELARNIAMHITAMKPEYIFQSEITEDVKKTINEIFQKEIKNIDKPEDIKTKILEGKTTTYFKEKTLLDQTFIKNSDETISELLDKNKAKIQEVKRYSI